MAGLRGGFLEIEFKPSRKAPAVFVPQEGSKRNLSPRLGMATSGPLYPVPQSRCLASSPSWWSGYQSPAQEEITLYLEPR